jgi:Copper type II ascorbate-dependent monooxygenase, C-terminal domain
MRTRLAFFFVLATSGCGHQDAGTAPDGGAGVGGDAPQSYSITFGPLAIPAGTENTQCIVKRLGNPAALHVGSIHDVLGNSSHHMVVYRVNDTTEQTTPFNCKPFQDTATGNGAPIIISQKNDDTLTMPDGVAYTLDANQMLRIELHYINATQSDVMLSSTTTFNSVSNYSAEASFLLIGDTDIKIPSGADVTLGPVFLPLDPMFADAHFFALTGHEHQLGTNVQVASATSETDPGTMVYDVPNWSWSEPKTVALAPALTMATGGGFRFTCKWHNPNSDTSAPPVVFGESANDEMCFFWAYYYPSHGSHVCLHSDAGGKTTNRCIN